jgi:hypothetical protein
MSDETKKLREAIAQAIIQKRTPKNLDRYNRKWVKGGDNSNLYPATQREAQEFPLAQKRGPTMKQTRFVFSSTPILSAVETTGSSAPTASMRCPLSKCHFLLGNLVGHCSHFIPLPVVLRTSVPLPKRECNLDFLKGILCTRSYCFCHGPGIACKAIVASSPSPYGSTGFVASVASREWMRLGSSPTYPASVVKRCRKALTFILLGLSRSKVR